MMKRYDAQAQIDYSTHVNELTRPQHIIGTKPEYFWYCDGRSERLVCHHTTRARAQSCACRAY